MMSNSNIRAIVSANLRKISSSSIVEINNTPIAAKLLFNICYCTFKKGRSFWSEVEDRERSICSVLSQINLSCSLSEFYGPDYDTITKLKCGDLEISSLLRENMLINPSHVGEIILFEFKEMVRGYSNISMQSELRDLFVWVLEKLGSKIVYNPYAGMGDLECSSIGSSISIEAEFADEFSKAVASMRFEMRNIPNRILGVQSLKSTLSNHPLAETMFMFPPLGVRVPGLGRETLETKIIKEFIQSPNLKKGIAVVSPSLCFKKETEFLRKELLKAGLTCVIALPNGILSGTMIAPYLLILDKDNVSGEVKFISLLDCTKNNNRVKSLDLDKAISAIESNESMSVVVPAIEIFATENVTLNPGLYLLDSVIPKRDGYVSYSLNDLLDSISVNSCRQGISSICKVVGIQDLNYSYDFLKKGVVATGEPRGGAYTRIESDCILISQTAAGLKTGLAKSVTSETPMYLSQTVKPFNIKLDVDKEYLLFALSEDYIRKQVELMKNSCGLFEVSGEIRVLVPSLQVQNEIVSKARQQVIANLESSVEIANRKFREDIHTKRHALGQTIGNLGAALRLLKMMRQSETQCINENEKIPNTDMTLGNILDGIENVTQRLANQIDRFDRGYRHAPAKFNLIDYVRNYAERRYTSIFKYEIEDKIFVSHKSDASAGFFINLRDVTDDNDIRCSIYFPEGVLGMILDNILHNACSHGFNFESKSENRVRIVVENVQDNVVLSVSNNGVPCAEYMTAEDIQTYGKSTAFKTTAESNGNLLETWNNSKHCGIGGYEIRQLLNEFGAKLEIILDSTKDYPVEYRLIFKSIDE